jgi:hypothetical protein
MITDLKDPKTNEILFKKEELICKGTKEGKLAQNFADELIRLRLVFGQPMIINSCCRSFSYNKKIGGIYKSFHVYDNNVNGVDGTCAIDVKRINGIYTAELLKAALYLNWSVGIARSFIHLDLRTKYKNLPQVVFSY